MVDHERLARAARPSGKKRISDEWLTREQAEAAFGISRTTFWR